MTPLEQLDEALKHADEYRQWIEDGNVALTDIEEDLLLLVEAARKYSEILAGDMVLVPREPTEAMLSNVRREQIKADNFHNGLGYDSCFICRNGWVLFWNTGCRALGY